jgi:hypothetical protein
MTAYELSNTWKTIYDVSIRGLASCNNVIIKPVGNLVAQDITKFRLYIELFGVDSVILIDLVNQFITRSKYKKNPS